MSKVYFITHPEVIPDSSRAVPKWRLSQTGIERMRAFAESSTPQTIKAVWSSAETKAIEAAGILSAAIGLGVRVLDRLHENDRSATGFLPPLEFEEVASSFFANPDQSVRGWERAADAQARIVAASDSICKTTTGDDIAIVAHGGVGTLLLCHLLNTPISRSYDQPFQGHYWAYDRTAGKIEHQWMPIAPR